VGEHLPVHGVGVGVGVGLAVGVGVEVGVGEGPDCAQYLPPVSEGPKWLSNPPHTIISVPVQTAVCPPRPEAALAVLVALQLFVPGLYLAPVS